MTWRDGAWRTVPASVGLTRAELDGLIEQAKAAGMLSADAVYSTKRDCVKALSEARQRAYAQTSGAPSQDHFPGRARKRARRCAVDPDRCQISAAEVNAFLRSLPPSDGRDP